MDITVSQPVAEFFMDQCIGSSNGHMAAIPNNPVIDSLCKAHSVSKREEFSRFIRQIADRLEEKGEF